MHISLIDLFGCAYLAGFAAIAAAGLSLSKKLRLHMQTNHQAKWDGMVSLQCPIDFSLQSTMRARVERSRAVDQFLKRKDYLELNDPALEIICRRLRLLKTIGIIYLVIAMIVFAIIRGRAAGTWKATVASNSSLRGNPR